MIYEKWKQINNSSYSVSVNGKVKNIRNGHILKPSIDRYGYYKLSYHDNDNTLVYKTVHRLVAETWIKNPSSLPQVNHKDGNKLNNKISNLEWCTAKHNIVHSYENLLNSNTTPVTLLNVVTKESKNFRSIKDLSRHLEIYTSALVPLIKNSFNNPIYSLYAVSVKEEELMLLTSNTVNSGKCIFVYDSLTEKINKYSSILIASYHTGIRSLGNITNVMTKIGYYLAFDISTIPKNIIVDVEEIKLLRIKYLNEPYRKRKIVYYVYNYYSKQTLGFKELKDCVYYFNIVKPLDKIITNVNVSQAIGDGVRRDKTGLLKGHGVTSSFQEYKWFPYNEEVILSNYKGYSAPVRVYKVIIGNTEEIIYGMENLCKYLNHSPDKPLKNITHEEIEKASNIPNLSIRRLNLPIS